MKSASTLLFSLCALGVAVPAPASWTSSLELKAVFQRAVGDRCGAPESPGDSRSTKKCKGISYLTGLCPQDRTDVQLSIPRTRVGSRLDVSLWRMSNIDCLFTAVWRSPAKPPHGRQLCRSVKNNGCSDGKFKLGCCPGSTDIQCYVRTAPPPQATPNHRHQSQVHGPTARRP
jgi:hypothetical protein